MHILRFNTYDSISPQSGFHTLSLYCVRAPISPHLANFGGLFQPLEFCLTDGTKNILPEDSRSSPSFQWPCTFSLVFTFSFLPTFPLGICLFLPVCCVACIANVILSPQPLTLNIIMVSWMVQKFYILMCSIVPVFYVKKIFFQKFPPL